MNARELIAKTRVDPLPRLSDEDLGYILSIDEKARAVIFLRETGTYGFYFEVGTVELNYVGNYEFHWDVVCEDSHFDTLENAIEHAREDARSLDIQLRDEYVPVK